MNHRKRKSSQRSAGAKKPAASKSKSAAAKNMLEITGDALVGMIAERAYFKAERRGFQGGNPEEDWYEAEAEIDGMLNTPGSRKRGGRDCAQKERRRRRHNLRAS
jgi:hypothetical protein